MLELSNRRVRALPVLGGALVRHLAACSVFPCASDSCAVEGQSAAQSSGGSTAEIEVGDPTVYDIPLKDLFGAPTSLAEHRGKVLLIVNVASECGLTPQYVELERLQQDYAERGFSVIGFPCNQFGGQEPGNAQEIQAFCDDRYHVTFPLMEKIEVNGPGRHPLYRELTAVSDASGAAGDVQWNFEKFVVSADGGTIVRFRPRTKPDAPEVIAAIEATLPH